MLAEQQIALALRKARIVLRAGQQREQLARHGESLRTPCAVADKVLAAGRYVRAHPWTAGVAVGVAAWLMRRKGVGWAGYAWRAWRTWRLVSAWAQDAGFINAIKNK